VIAERQLQQHELIEINTTESLLGNIKEDSEGHEFFSRS
jgi:hypothetical protein